MTDTARQNRIVLHIITPLCFVSVIAFPIGLITMWAGRLYPPAVRWSLTGLFGIVVAAVAVGPAPASSKPAGDQASSSSPVAQAGEVTEVDPPDAQAPAPKRPLPAAFYMAVEKADADTTQLIADFEAARALPWDERRARLNLLADTASQIDRDLIDAEILAALPQRFYVRGKVKDKTPDGLLLWGMASAVGRGGGMGEVMENQSIVVLVSDAQIPVGAMYADEPYFRERRVGRNAFGGEVPVWVYGPLTEEERRAFAERDEMLKAVRDRIMGYWRIFNEREPKATEASTP